MSHLSRTRRTAAAAVVLALLAVAPAARGYAPKDGTVELPTVQPSIARAAYTADARTNGFLGYVVTLDAPVPDGTAYTLSKLEGPPGAQLNAYFYSDLRGPNGLGYPCRNSGDPRPNGSGGETGRVSCGDSNLDGVVTNADRARYAVVVLLTGAHTRFGLATG